MHSIDEGRGSNGIDRRAALLLAALLAAFVITPKVLHAQAATQAATPASAPPDTSTKVTFGAFVDGYYAWDFNRPATFDRAFTTQPARHDEFNVNLAFAEVKLDAPRMRGRLALQAGTSVQSNYAAEPRNGNVSGPDVSRFIQEAVAGVKLADNLWVDGGVFFSHIGVESFISRDNPTYTRSLVADYTPYYESGAKLTWQATPALSVLVAVLNGWQNISETNSAKSAGVRVDYAPSASTTISYYDYLGDEAPDSAAHRQVRVFNGASLKTNVTSNVQLAAELDYGTQQRASGNGSANWYGAMLTGRLQATTNAALVARVERYEDKEQVLVVTGTPDGFRASGASIGVDVTPQSRVLWRTELRGFRGERAVFPKRTSDLSRSDAFIVTSLALTL